LRITLTERRTPIPEKIIFAGGNAYRLGSNHFGNEIELRNRFGLTRLALLPRTVLVEIACSPLTTGPSHLISLGSPLLNSSNAWDCARKMARIESGESHLSMAVANGWLRRS
jgi:hypothetical protein